ncbi:MAG: gamma carbonic anhydrase family protein [Candidatus Thorarchaeota archaeon]
MGVYEFEERIPVIGKNTYISHTASVIGKVIIGEECYVAPGAVVKGDYGEIEIGDGVSVQDNVIIHARPGENTMIGHNVTLGHGCMVHNATIRDNAVIGMGAIVSDDRNGCNSFRLCDSWELGNRRRRCCGTS